MQLITLLTTLLLAVSQFLPSTKLTQSVPFTEAALADFAGTWVGHTASGEFKIVLEERKDYRMPNGRNYDLIVGRHSYTAKGESALNESLPKPAGDFAIMGAPDQEHPEQLLVTFSDDVNHKIVLVNLSFVGSDKTRLRWAITRETETVVTDPAIRVLPGVSVPTNLVLEKANR